MKFIPSLKAALAALGLIGALSSATVARADLTYLVDINTSSIVNNAAGPFYLDLQSLFGSGSAQTVTLSNFNLTGGGLLAGTDTSIGAVTGSPAGSLVFNPNAGSFYNEFFQQFGAGVSDIKFTLNLTTNASGVQPTSFAVAVLDSNVANIPTTGIGDSLLLFSLDGGNTSYLTGTSTGDTGGVTISLTAIPEPSTYALLTGAVALVAVWRRRQTGRAQISA